MPLDKEFASHWHSKLNVLEKYMVMGTYLARALLVDAPAVLDPPVDDAVAECIDVLEEVRRVARAWKLTAECQPHAHHACCMSCTARSASCCAPRWARSGSRADGDAADNFCWSRRSASLGTGARHPR